MKKKILITGSHGYIAKNIAKKLKKKILMFMELAEANGEKKIIKNGDT